MKNIFHSNDKIVIAIAIAKNLKPENIIPYCTLYCAITITYIFWRDFTIPTENLIIFGFVAFLAL